MSQCSVLLSHMQAGGTLTPDDAYRLARSHACHSRMAELREQGWPVICVIQRIGDKNVGVYSLPESHIVRQKELVL